jgi:hypothetical protein
MFISQVKEEVKSEDEESETDSDDSEEVRTK